MFGCFWTNGQICSATSRLLVHESIYDRFISRLVEETKKIHVGEPLAEENKDRTGMMGPLASQMQYQKVMKYIEVSIQEGAKVSFLFRFKINIKYKI